MFNWEFTAFLKLLKNYFPTFFLQSCDMNYRLFLCFLYWVDQKVHSGFSTSYGKTRTNVLANPVQRFWKWIVIWGGWTRGILSSVNVFALSIKTEVGGHETWESLSSSGVRALGDHLDQCFLPSVISLDHSSHIRLPLVQIIVLSRHTFKT